MTIKNSKKIKRKKIKNYKIHKKLFTMKAHKKLKNLKISNKKLLTKIK